MGAAFPALAGELHRPRPPAYCSEGRWGRVVGCRVPNFDQCRVVAVLEMRNKNRLTQVYLATIGPCELPLVKSTFGILARESLPGRPEKTGKLGWV